jgi:hypothetical protein
MKKKLPTIDDPPPRLTGEWSAVTSVEDETQAAELVVTEVIDFANGTITPPWQGRMQPLGESEDEGFVVWTDADAELVDTETARAHAEREIEAERQFAVNLLTSAARGIDDLTSFVVREVRRGVTSSFSMRPTLRVSGSRVLLRWALQGPLKMTGRVIFAGALLASRPHGRQTDIGRCQLSSCEKFFKIDWSEGNRPRTRYCNPEHRIAFHQQHAAERKRRSRAAGRGRKK